MKKIPTLTAQEILQIFRDKIVLDQPNPAVQLFHSSMSANIQHDFFELSFENITIRPEFSLNISKFKIKETFNLEVSFPVETIGFTFSFLGDSIFHIPYLKEPVPFPEKSFTIFRCKPHTGIQELMPGPFISINIHFTKKSFVDLISNYSNDYNKLSDLLEGEDYLKIDLYKPKLKPVLQELLDNKFTGLSRQFFIESKVFELLATQMESQFFSNKNSSINEDLMHQCKNMLEENFAAPPSLIELAKSVGTNTFYLKRDFNNTFGTSPYAYLKNYRLNKAMTLLGEKSSSVKEVAKAIGYESVGSFSNAFYEKFGIRPINVKNTF